MYDEKTLLQKIEQFKEKINTRNKKLNENISILVNQVKQKESEIEKAMKELIQAELKEDFEKQKDLNSKITIMRHELSDMKDKCNAYNNAILDNSYFFADIEEIRKVAALTREKRYHELTEKIKEKSLIRQEINELENQLNELDKIENSLRVEKEIMSLRSIIGLIDPRAEKLDYYKKEEYLRAWISNEDVEKFFTRERQHENNRINLEVDTIKYPGSKEFQYGKCVSKKVVQF